MTLPPLATPAELSAYVQRPVPEASAILALTLASGKVRGYINRPGHPALTDATTAPDDVRAVVLAVAGRVVVNPSDLRQEAVGGLSATYGTETIGVQLTESERFDLRRFRVGARTIEMQPGTPPRVPPPLDEGWEI